YREGDLPLTKVFDVNEMGKLLALTDLIGDYHTLQYGSPRIGAYHPRAKLMPHHMAVLGRAGTPQSRFYYNPVIGLIEPIAYDNSGIKGEGLVLIGSGRRFAEQGNRKSDWMWPLVLFQDKLLFKKYIESLEEITDKSYLDRFFLETKDEAQERLSLLHRDFPFRKLDMKPIFYKNRERIKKQLQPQKSLNIYFDGVSKGDGILHLDIANIHAFPVEVLGVSLDNINIIKPLKDSIVQARQIVGDDDHWDFMHRPGTRNVIRRGWWDNAKET
ncbi:uncharacterized protein METZ01_LOCUS421678, partial [marine metagenome]